MRRRVVRDLGTIVGIVVILIVVVFVNDYMRRGSQADWFEKARRHAEAMQKTQGTPLLSWELLRKTKGTKRTGPIFDGKLLECKDQFASLIGFMVPLEEFHNISTFLLLPLPIECYFCQMPPMRDVVLVQMAENNVTDLVREPVLINGTLQLNEGPGTKFFYIVKDASRNPAEKGQKLHAKPVRPEAISHSAGAKDAAEGNKEQLIEGQTPPTSAPAESTK